MAYTYIILYSNELEDVSEFIEKFKWVVSPNHSEKSRGLKTGVFEILTEGDNTRLSQVFEENEISKLVEENERLKSKNKKLKKKLKGQLPKQDLSINEELTKRIIILRKKKKSFEWIAKKLNEEGYKNSRGNQLNLMQVSRLYKKYSA